MVISDLILIQTYPKLVKVRIILQKVSKLQNCKTFLDFLRICSNSDTFIHKKIRNKDCFYSQVPWVFIRLKDLRPAKFDSIGSKQPYAYLLFLSTQLVTITREIMWVNPSYLPWYLSDTCDRPPWDILTFTDDLVSRKMQKITVLTLTFKIKENMLTKIKLREI